MKNEQVSTPTVAQLSDPIKVRNEQIAILHGTGSSQAELGKLFGLSRQRIQQILVRLNGDSTPIEKRSDVLRQLSIDFIEEVNKGLDVDQVIEHLGIKPASLKRILDEYLKTTKSQIRYSQWVSQLVGARYNDWTILWIFPMEPEKPVRSTSSAIARCEGCQGIFTLKVDNIIRGASKRCTKCAMNKRKYSQPIVDTKTGNYFSSMVDAMEFFGYTRGKLGYLIRSGRFKRV